MAGGAASRHELAYGSPATFAASVWIATARNRVLKPFLERRERREQQLWFVVFWFRWLWLDGIYNFSSGLAGSAGTSAYNLSSGSTGLSASGFAASSTVLAFAADGQQRREQRLQFFFWLGGLDWRRGRHDH